MRIVKDIRCIYCNEICKANHLSRHLRAHHQKTVLDYLLKLTNMDSPPLCSICNERIVAYNVLGWKTICKDPSCRRINKGRKTTVSNLERSKNGSHPFLSKNRKKTEDGLDVLALKVMAVRKERRNLWYKENRPVDENGKDLLAQKMLVSGKCSLLRANRPKDENGKDLYASLAARSSVRKGTHNFLKANRHFDSVTGRDLLFKQRVLNIADLNEEYFRTHLVKDGIFQMADCISHFGIAPSTANGYKIRFLGHMPESEKGKGKYHERQNEVMTYLQSLGVDEIISDCRSITEDKKELDIYLPKQQIAIEFDGLYWHSNIDPNYHVNKTNACEARGIHLFHIFENEWLDPIKRNIWKSVLTNALGLSKHVYARQCEIHQVTIGSKDFLVENHLQGHCISSINYGLYLNDELVSLMTFGKSRFDSNYDYELLRFCCKKGLTVIGGASKLLKHFRADYPGTIVSYANRRWSKGHLYETLGFTKCGITEPNYYFTKDCYTLLSRYTCMKQKLPGLLGDAFNKNLTAYQNMVTNGYRIVYDCGNIKYILN
ncbi:MAG: hypothetical protein MJZ34_02495 [Paludibacteraceae bacterium]|nr:hypothetical protein [Paludibacteraceae bacterium]